MQNIVYLLELLFYINVGQCSFDFELLIRSPNSKLSKIKYIYFPTDMNFKKSVKLANYCCSKVIPAAVVQPVSVSASALFRRFHK